MLNTDYKRNLNRNRGRGWSVPTVLLAAITVVAGAVGDTHAQCQYEVTAIIQAPPCDIGTSPTFGQGLNINGEIVGYYWPCAIGNDRAFFWSQDTGLVTLPNPPGVIAARAYDVNDNRMIVGQHLFPSVGWKGFAYDMATGEYQHLEPLHDGATATSVSSANAVNNAGVVAGMRIIGKSGNTPHNAVIWDTNTGEITDLGVMEGPNSAALDINEAGHIAVGWDGTITPTGTIGRLWVDNRPIDIGAIPGGDTSWASFISHDGFVSGSGMNVSELYSRAFLWREGEFTLIDPPIQFNSSTGGAVNDVGQLLVRCATGSTSRPYLWQHGEMNDLNELTTSGPQLTHTSDINNNGQVLVRAATRAVLLSPTDVPFADLNYDCKVDGHDLVILLDSWGPQAVKRGADGTNTHPADLNGDGVVDGHDLLILLANWNP